MKWVTRRNAGVDRLACSWLIRRFIDPECEILFVPGEYVARVAEKEEAVPFDVPDVEFTHHDGKCTFETMVSHYKIQDIALERLALIVHAADIAGELDSMAEGPGLLAFANGLQKTTDDDNRKTLIAYPLFDALHKHCQTVIDNEIEGT